MEELIEQAKNILDQILIMYRENKRIPNQINSENQIFFDNDTFEVMYKDKNVKLTHNEGIIILELISTSAMFCTYNQLSKKIYDYKYDKTTSAPLKITICRLRKKVAGMFELKTIRGKGIKIIKK